MGRGIATEPVPVEIVREAFTVRLDGTLCWRGTSRSATFVGAHGVPMVRLRHDGRIRRLSAARVVFALAHGQWPSGHLRKRAYRRAAVGGNSSLVRRAGADVALIRALAAAERATIAQLSRLTDSPESCVSTRLGRLAEASPKARCAFPAGVGA